MTEAATANYGRTIAVQGVSPGNGRTVIAGNLAFELAARGSRVCLIDLDDQRPSLHRVFGLPQQQAAVLAAMRFLEQDKLDANTLEQLAVRLVSKGVGIDLLSGYGLNLNSQAINLGSLAALLHFLTARYDFVVIDAPQEAAGAIGSVVVGAADHRLVVVAADPVNLGRLLERHADDSAENSTLVINRLRASVLGSRPQWQVQQLLNQRTSFQAAAVIPEDPAFDDALLGGLPLRQAAPKSKALKAIEQLAMRVSA